MKDNGNCGRCSKDGNPDWTKHPTYCHVWQAGAKAENAKLKAELAQFRESNTNYAYRNHSLQIEVHNLNAQIAALKAELARITPFINAVEFYKREIAQEDRK